MDTIVPAEMLEALKSGKSRRKSRLRVSVDGVTYPVLRLLKSGFAVNREETPHLRGCVDLFDGGRHLASCLIVRAEPDGSMIHYEYKRSTKVQDAPPVDYAVDQNAPVAYLR